MKKVIFFALATILVFGTISQGIVFADNNDGQSHFKKKKDINNEPKTITLFDLGVLQLAAHDLFNVDRGDRINAETAIDHENGKLDLSTLFVDTTTDIPFDDEMIAIGGEIRNRENIMLFTVSSQLGGIYLSMIEFGLSEDKAKKITIKIYHNILKDTFEKTFDSKFPKKKGGEATLTENLALRTIHDFLPGEIIVDGASTQLLSIPPMTVLDRATMMQNSSPLDGQFDEEFLNIVINHPGGPAITINLLEADSDFADQFDTKKSFEFFLEELEDGKYDKKDKVTKHIKKLIAKGLNF